MGSAIPATLGQIRQRLRDAGARPCHEVAVLRAWTHALPLDSGSRPPEDFLPLSLRAALPAVAQQLDALTRVHSRHAGNDGSVRLLLALADGRTIENVLLPPHGLCASTQVGCAVGCVFCMTGRDGVQRQLGSAEIVAQVVLGRSLGVVRKVVFMGMGGSDRALPVRTGRPREAASIRRTGYRRRLRSVASARHCAGRHHSGLPHFRHWLMH